MPEKHFTLAETVIDSAGSKYDSQLLGGISLMSEDIRQAQRFEFSPDIADACFTLGATKISSIVDALPMCALPFEKVWIEFSGADLSEGHTDPSRGFPTVERYGALLSSMDRSNRKFSAALVWKHRDQEFIHVSTLGYLVNWADGWSLTDMSDKTEARLLKEDRDFVNLPPAEQQAQMKFAETIVVAVPPYCAQFVEKYRKENPKGIQKIMEEHERSIIGDIKLIVAMICMLNSKNCVSLERRYGQRKEVAKIDGKNVKSKLSYSHVTISLSRRDAEAAAEAAASQQDIRRHVVRGHFKLRSSGVYWWRPFFRGRSANGEVRRSGYSVIDKPPRLP